MGHFSDADKCLSKKTFRSFSLSEGVPQDHFLRKAAEVVDLGFVRNCAYTYFRQI